LVRIEADTSNGISHGTGFFWKDRNHVITAYHVVYGSKKITLFYPHFSSSNVAIEYASNEHDLVLLAILERVTVEPTVFDMDESWLGNNFGLDAKLEVYGFPRGWTNSHRIEGYFTKSTFEDSSIPMNGEKPVFKPDNKMDLIPIACDMFSGLSGAPLIYGGQLIGVMSGSLIEGGSLSWAMPIKYVAEMRNFNLAPSQMKWPDLAYTVGFRSYCTANELPKSYFSAQIAAAAEVVNYDLEANLASYEPLLSLSGSFFWGSYKLHSQVSLQLEAALAFPTIRYQTLPGFQVATNVKRLYTDLVLVYDYCFFQGKELQPFVGVGAGGIVSFDFFSYSQIPVDISLLLVGHVGLIIFQHFGIEVQTRFFSDPTDAVEFNDFGNSIISQTFDYHLHLYVGLRYIF
jgi:hypothetical protein